MYRWVRCSHTSPVQSAQQRKLVIVPVSMMLTHQYCTVSTIAHELKCSDNFRCVSVLIIIHKCASYTLNGCHTHQICDQCINEMHKVWAWSFTITSTHQNFSQCIMMSGVFNFFFLKCVQKLHTLQSDHIKLRLTCCVYFYMWVYFEICGILLWPFQNASWHPRKKGIKFPCLFWPPKY